MALLGAPMNLLPQPGLLNRIGDWWKSDPMRQDRMKAMFQGWSQGGTMGESLGLGAQGMLGARADQRKAAQQQDATAKINALLGVQPFPTMADVNAQRPTGFMGAPMGVPLTGIY